MVTTVKANAGYTLVEIIMTLAVVGILTGVATVSHRGTKIDNKKRELQSSSQMWWGNISTCIVASGGWKLCQPCKDPDDQTECPPPPQPPAIPECREGTKLVFPCKATGLTQTDIKESLKKKLNYDCPQGANCHIFTHPTPQSGEEFQYHCLSIEKEVSGKKLQIITRVQWSNTGIFAIWCNKKNTELSAYETLRPKTCREGKDGPNQGGIGVNLEKCTWK